MLQRTPQKGTTLPARPWSERAAGWWRRLREVARFTGFTVVRRRRYLYLLGLYLWVASAYMATWAAVLPLLFGFAVYLDAWLRRRGTDCERRGLGRESLRAGLRAWVRERWRAGWVHHNWRRGCYGYNLVQGGDNQRPAKGRHRPYPKPKRIVWDLAGDARMWCNNGDVQVPSTKIKNLQRELAEAMHCPEVIPRDTATKGVMEVALYWQSTLDRLYQLGDVPLAGNRRMVSVGVTREGSPFIIPKHMPLIVTGIPGSGKSNFGQGLLGLLLADADWVEVWFVDSKGGMEFAAFEPLLGQGWVGDHGHLKVAGYCTSGDDAEQPGGVIEQVRVRVQELQALARTRKVREFTTTSEETPLVLLVVDEAKRIPNALARKPVKDRNGSKAGNAATSGMDLDWIASQGRAVQVVPILFTQDARAETIPGPMRTLFPTRIGFATDNAASTNCALGDGAENDLGAHCSELRPFIDAGRFYGRCMELETAGKMFEPGKTAMVSDEDVALIATGQVPPALLARHPYDAARTCILYRVWEFPDARGLRRFGYVGETWQGFEERAAGHRENRPVNMVHCPEHGRVENWWAVHIDESTVMVDEFPSKRAAQAAERAAIKAELPYWNRVHNQGNRLSAANSRKPPRPPRQPELVGRRRPDFVAPPGRHHSTWGAE